MATVKRDTRAIAPGHEPERLKTALERFFDALDGAFPGKRIIWRDWDHARFDRLAGYLCAELGYSAGAPFLTAYGYTIVTEYGILRPEGAAGDEAAEVAADAAALKPDAAENETEAPTQARKESPADEPEAAEAQSAAEEHGAPGEESAVHTGKIVHVLANGNSGFVRDDETGSDYYFNVRSFTRWVDALTPGRAVSFRLARRFDRSHDRVRENAVALSYVE